MWVWCTSLAQHTCACTRQLPVRSVSVMSMLCFSSTFEMMEQLSYKPLPTEVVCLVRLLAFPCLPDMCLGLLPT